MNLSRRDFIRGVVASGLIARLGFVGEVLANDLTGKIEETKDFIGFVFKSTYQGLPIEIEIEFEPNHYQFVDPYHQVKREEIRVYSKEDIPYWAPVGTTLVIKINQPPKKDFRFEHIYSGGSKIMIYGLTKRNNQINPHNVTNDLMLYMSGPISRIDEINRHFHIDKVIHNYAQSRARR